MQFNKNNSNQIPASVVRQVLFLLLIVSLGIYLGYELSFMLSAFLGAITLYVLLRNVFIKMVIKLKWKKWVAALTLIVSTIIIFIIPVSLLLFYGFNQIAPYVNHPEIVTNAFDQIHNYLIKKINIDILDKTYIAKVNAAVMPFAKKTLGGTADLFSSLAMMYFILYYMLVESLEMEHWVKNNLPFKRENINKFINESRSIVYGNAIGIPILALIQGMVGLVGYWIFGVENAITFGLLTAIGSVVPIVGTAIVYVPLAAYLMAIGNTVQGFEVLAWGIIVIGSVDNVARFALAKRFADVHPLITVFGVIIGINIFGFLGIIFGPFLISIFILLLEIYFDEFGNKNEQSEA